MRPSPRDSPEVSSPRAEGSVAACEHSVTESYLAELMELFVAAVWRCGRTWFENYGEAADSHQTLARGSSGVYREDPGPVRTELA